MKVKGNKKLLWAVTALILLSVLGFGLYQLMQQPTDNTPEKKEDMPSYRAAYHFTAPDHWKNDPQRPIYADGKYHYYYLYNKDYPKGNGTEWRHAASEDLVHWKDEGVAIPKYTNENGDPWSGSVVIDKENTAGFGKNAWIAVLTQPSKDGGKQEQFLWYSRDNGITFKSYSDKPVLANPGTKDFRDPKIIRDEQHDKWVMTMAEGNKIGFYESNNLKDWKYTSSFSTDNLGVLECPDLYMMRADDGTMKWMLGFSANGSAIGEPNTYAYWTGSFDGSTFTPDQEKPQWLDHGFDWYGGVTFKNGAANDPYEKRYAFAWMNNWAYPHNTPTVKEGFNGMDSVTRKIELKTGDDSSYYLASEPVKALEQLKGKTKTYDEIEVDGTKTLDVKADVYQLETDISWDEAKNIGVKLRESHDKKHHIDVGINAADQYSYVNRSFTDHPDKENKFTESKAPFDGEKKKVHLKILVDKTSIEVFVDDGKTVHSNLVYPRFEDEGISLFSDGGKSTFHNIKISHLKENR
ncbi:glycoside hydrolase family 32 protein [Fictibacillus fluitans]|uniref:Glycoside hydrolase family 32 protein n=1 Tax=Fictibacillus fluitans TaxID=3058422 RepID=A0ABT8I184_9BACL|nr:glycoside hydrolase family 32 protein [Fictibacillus sp. NE201]MDN4526460.1 glycoside hydrolase family 32 protein [Fictibacillus sp. NE201]